MKPQIKYKEGFKYQLAEDYEVDIGIIGYECDLKFIKLTLSGVLLIRNGYAWDGPSGPTFDTPDFMRGSLVHDALYQLMRLNVLSQAERNPADKLLRTICLEDGMPEFRADYVFAGVNGFGKRYADPKNKKVVIIAPGE